MGLITKLKSTKEKSTFFKSPSHATSSPTRSLFHLRNNKSSPQKLTTSISRLTVVSVPKEYREETPFNWMTNELDSFQYESGDSKRDARNKANNTSQQQPQQQLQDSDCAISDWLFPCWGSPRGDAKGTIHSTDETSYSSASLSEAPDDRTGQILQVLTGNNKRGGAEDVSDVTSAPSEDFSEESDAEDGDNSSTSSPCPYTVE